MTHSSNTAREERTGWLKAAVAALAINLVLLSILPVVNLGTVTLPRTAPAPQAVNFVRETPPDQTDPELADRREKETPPPETASPPEPAGFSLPPDYLDRTLRPDLQPMPVQADVPRLTDMPLAVIDFGARGMDGVFKAEHLDQPLAAVSRMPPFYPLGARRAAIEGWVEIEFLVDIQGRVEEIRIIRSQPEGVFEESVRQAVTGWRFQPGTVMGEPVRTRVTTTVRFKLEDNP